MPCHASKSCHIHASCLVANPHLYTPLLIASYTWALVVSISSLKLAGYRSSSALNQARTHRNGVTPHAKDCNGTLGRRYRCVKIMPDSCRVDGRQPATPHSPGRVETALNSELNMRMISLDSLFTIDIVLRSNRTGTVNLVTAPPPAFS